MFFRRRTGNCGFFFFFLSLISLFGEFLPLKAAERLEVQLDGMLIPISIRDLSGLNGTEEPLSSELSAWLNLMEPESRAGLLKLLKAPLLKERSMGRQMLRSWAGQELLDEISDLISVDEDMSGQIVFKTMETLLDSQPEITTLDLLEALPAQKIRLDLDGLLHLADRWRFQLKQQQKLVSILASLPSKSVDSSQLNTSLENSGVSPKRFPLFVPHRENPLDLELWRPFAGTPIRKSWIILMPGLGGTQHQFRWLAKSLSENGWPAVVLEHPGSDAEAVKALIEGRKPAPGAEVLPDRIADMKSVVKARNKGLFFVPGEKVVLMGHSLGALTALLASGSPPELGLASRCKNALDDLSLTNLSQLMQCQLVDVKLKNHSPVKDLQAIVALNSFGSLLWPRNWQTSLRIPVLFTGGTLDLVTPPLREQLGLFLSSPIHGNSRVLLIEGASHFSVIRMEDDKETLNNNDLFRLGKELVGVHPFSVQKILASEIIKFLMETEENKTFVSTESFEFNNLRFHRLNRNTVDKLLKI